MVRSTNFLILSIAPDRFSDGLPPKIIFSRTNRSTSRRRRRPHRARLRDHSVPSFLRLATRNGRTRGNGYVVRAETRARLYGPAPDSPVGRGPCDPSRRPWAHVPEKSGSTHSEKKKYVTVFLEKKRDFFFFENSARSSSTPLRAISRDSGERTVDVCTAWSNCTATPRLSAALHTQRRTNGRVSSS